MHPLWQMVPSLLLPHHARSQRRPTAANHQKVHHVKLWAFDKSNSLQTTGSLWTRLLKQSVLVSHALQEGCQSLVS